MTRTHPKQKNARAGARDSAFSDAIRAALAEADGEATKLHRVAQTLVALAIDGNMSAIKEISDRLEGKPGPSGSGAGVGGESETGPVEIRLKWLKD